MIVQRKPGQKWSAGTVGPNQDPTFWQNSLDWWTLEHRQTGPMPVLGTNEVEYEISMVDDANDEWRVEYWTQYHYCDMVLSVEF